MRNSTTMWLRTLRQFGHGLLLSLGFLPAIGSLPVSAAQLSGASMSTYTAGPVTTVSQVTPLVMLAMSRDHQYFFKAYNDFSDIDDDGIVEDTYDDTFDYYGYFHSELCYEYSDSDGRFNPVGETDGTGNNHFCTGSEAAAFSGNFLNWATMTRMDIVRKILYGGFRSTDTSSLTVLERAHLPTDAHSFVKYYNGADLDELTPFDSTANVITDTDGGDADGLNDAGEGITMCNTTYESSGSSQGSTSPPLFRIAYGNRTLWAANERWQCTWENERGDNPNGNIPISSGLDLIANDPADSFVLRTPSSNRDHRVRVRVCNDTFFDAANNLENCQQYPSGNRKPTGLLQRYGETGLIKFGLITGSWDKNISGGALRKNIGTMTDEINTTTDGTFKAAPANGGIVNTLNIMRIWGYSYGTSNSGNGNGTYFSGVSGDNCNFQLASISEGDCNAWGNPMAEIYLEALRYFSVQSSRGPTSAFNPNDSTYFTGMTDTTWTDPLSADNACASLNIIAFNASVSSYDNNATTDAILGGESGASLTTAVGDGEGINGDKFFIGESGGDNDQFCTVKEVDDLGDIAGLCPEGPTVEGSFHMAGLAHWARTNDIRSGLDGSQNVQTFAVALATAVPTIEVPLGPAETATEFVRILPAYRLINVSGGGAIVDFKVVRNHTEIDPTDQVTPGLANSSPDGNADITNGVPHSCVRGATGCTVFNNAGANGQIAASIPEPKAGTGIFHGKYYINWEDSEQGGDYDQDMWGTLDYVVDTTVSPVKITVTTTSVAQSTANGQLFGFVISGTTKDGFHAYSGILGANFTDPTGVTGCANCRALSESGGQRGPQSYTFTVGGDGAGNLLKDPLYYAAKWGGFNDSDDDGTPNLQKEWDIRDASGEFTADLDGDSIPDGDGQPDNFFFVSNPAALEDALTAVFDIIIERVSSGTAAAVVANDQEGVGAVFQALYDPIKSDSTAAQNEVTWIGTLQALWVDEFGLIREDNDQDGKLDGYDVDRVVEVFFDEIDRRAKIKRYTSSDPLEFTPVDLNPTPLELPNLKTVWNARQELSDLDNDTMENQRDYTTPVGTGANAGRHILTWMDDDFDDIVAPDGSEIVEFTTTSFSSGDRHRWLDEGDVTIANNLINWVRGKEITGLRNRTVDYEGDDAGGTAEHASGNLEVQRLGDVIHSTPIPVATPSEAYDLLALDTSYAEFRACYANRRQVIYVGGNDGMIHAFNGGFYDAANRKFELSRDGEVEHPLGAELWAYIPKNLLPHLQWLARPDYSHVFYMDQSPRVFDAKIFEPSDDCDGGHPGGWGTVMVVGMRLGGAADSTAISLDIDDDGTTDVTTKSALVVLDVTDPEAPPVVLAELSPATLNYTTSFPQVMVVGDPIRPGDVSDTSSPNKWYLVFGSGPTNLADVTSTQTGRLFAYDLEALAKGRVSLNSIDDARVTSGPFATGVANLSADTNTFVGDPVVVDLDVDMKAEALYVGTVGAVAGNSGSLWRMAIGEQDSPLNWGSPFKLLAANQPFLAQPSVTIDETFRTWVMAGTGRLYVNADKVTTGQQTLYGFIDPNPLVGNNSSAVAIDLADLVDVSDAEVRTNGDVDLDDDGDVDSTFDGLVDEVSDAGGWMRDYTVSSPDPSQRSINRSTLIDGVLFNSAFTPSTDLCTSEGTSILLGLSFRTGTALPTPIFGEIPCAGCPTGVNESRPYVDLGAGLASTPSIHIGNQDIPGKVTVITQKSTGAIETTDATTLGGIANGEISWREYRAY